MIPCHICGRDASTGRVTGFIPAPDSQKLALCQEHDTEDNRLLVDAAWQEAYAAQLAGAFSVAASKATPFTRKVTVHFTGGGLLSFACTACAPTDHDALRIDDAAGNHTFIPMRHIREYTVSPMAEQV